MKTLFTLLFLFIGGVVLAKDGTEITRVSDDTYKSVTILGDHFAQIGYYKLIDGVLEQDGRWIEYSVIGKTIVKYDDGHIVWIKTPDGAKYSSVEIQMVKLKTKIQKLESLLANN